MTRTYSVTTTFEPADEDLSEIEVKIHFTVIPGGGDGWNEPRYGAHPEFSHATFGLTLAATDTEINDWAEEWLREHPEKATDAVADDVAAAAEYMREARNGR